MACGAENLRKTPFGQLNGKTVYLYTLANADNMEVDIANYGATIVSIKTPDRRGNIDDVVLGFDSLDGYRQKQPYLGATIGRFANRIGNGRFVLNGVEYALTQNENGNHLHGGFHGFDKAVWDVAATSSGENPSIMLHYLSRDGEEGYPGDLDVTVRYELTPDNELKMEYRATTDKTTVVNMTNHSYFNLAGAGSGDVLSHDLMIDGDAFTPIAIGYIPTGEIRSIAGTPFDFRRSTSIGKRINADDPQLHLTAGYSANVILNKHGQTMSLAARVIEPVSGRVMELYTTEPAVQFYTANRLGDLIGKNGKAYHSRGALCLEPQHCPDSPNHPNFPSAILHPNETYHSMTVYKFSVR